MNQKLSDWASIAEIVGAAAIVVSLIFVGLQIGSNTNATQAATLQQSVGFETDILLHLASADAETIVNFEYQSQGQDFTDRELPQMRGEFLYLAAMRMLEDLYLQWNAGTLSDEAWSSRQFLVQSVANGPGLELLIELGYLHEDFENYLIGIRAE